jgi:hypothetical protein
MACVGGRERCDVLAVAHDGDAVGDALEFVHLVRDVDDADAVRLELVDDGEEVRRSRRSFRAAVGSSMMRTRELEGQGLGDFDQLLRATVMWPTSAAGSILRCMRLKIAAASAFIFFSSTNMPKPRRGSRPMKMFCAAVRWFIRLSS